MTGVEGILELHDLDLMLAEARALGPAADRLKRLGLEVRDPKHLERLRTRLVAGVDRRWLNHYERALRRYGRALTRVRERVCQGCFITLPTSASPGVEESLTLCESCGRILYWR